jgi:multiple sugar transport system ATP-binding protein
MRAELSRLHRRLGATMIYVTHDQLEAMTLGHRIAVMRDGVVHQVAAPEEVYAQPADRFVAGFIGSPAMNFIEGTVEQQNGGPTLRSSNVTLPLGQIPAARGASLGGQKVTLGVRPEHLSIGRASSGTAQTVTVEVIEPMGPETHVHVRLGDATWVARVPPDTPVRPDERVELGLDMAHAHLFDKDTGKRLEGANP